MRRGWQLAVPIRHAGLSLEHEQQLGAGHACMRSVEYTPWLNGWILSSCVGSSSSSGGVRHREQAWLVPPHLRAGETRCGERGLLGFSPQ